MRHTWSVADTSCFQGSKVMQKASNTRGHVRGATQIMISSKIDKKDTADGDNGLDHSGDNA